MINFEDYIKIEYSFLYDHGFINKEIINNRSFSTVYIHNNELELYFCFIIEKGLISVSISTDCILNKVIYSKYDKNYDFFYIVKLLCTEKEFADIKPLIYPQIIETNWRKITTLFNNKNIDETIIQINRIEKQYNKVRWDK